VYEYDVFISYKRAGANVPAWIRTHFYPRLSELLDDNHDREVKIFFDDTIPGGTAWPLELRAALGRTRILLGSRSGEAWLAKDTFGDNIHDLGGLDPEATSTLTDRILERYQVSEYRKEENLQHLIKLLDGFPLALEVVLSNLTHQTPDEVLTALQAGNVSLNVGTSQDKTENIIRCIDYSHSNLSPQAQQLLLCLAPFTSVLRQDWLDGYTHYLKQQSILAIWPFDQWQQVIEEGLRAQRVIRGKTLDRA